MTRCFLTFCILHSAFCIASAASYYVRTNGSDLADGSLATPWRTIQKALNTITDGDTALIGHGDFGEWVQTAQHATSYRTLLAETNYTCSTRQIRVSHRNYWFSGIKVDKSIDKVVGEYNNAHIRIEPAATATVISNCWISDTPMLNSRMHFVTNNTELLCTVTNSSENFLTNNFVEGGYVFLGANSLTYHTNHDRAARIKAISADGLTLTVTNNAGTNYLIEQNQNRWATIFSGQGNGGFEGIHLVLVSDGPTNCVIINNVLSNLTGAAFIVNGESNRIEGNRITRLNGYYAIRPFGRHTIVRNNTWKDSTNRIWFSSSETSDITHPGDGSFFDYNIGAIHSQGSGTTNLLFERNWLENMEQQLGVISKQNQTNQGGFLFRSNVFIGFLQHMSVNSDWVGFSNNTFYRVAIESSHPLGAGGFNPSNIQTNLSIVGNVFIDCGSQHSPSTGWYSTTDTYNMLLTNNFVCGSEATYWHAKTTTPSNHITFNGGDPIFVNILNPIGPDGLAFTDDDGLKPLTNSILAQQGLGALTPLTTNFAAHFSIASPTNWLDYTYTNFSQAWVALEPFERGGPVRSYRVADPICNVPGIVKFTGTNSLGASKYAWDFGDGYRVMTTTNGEAYHRFGRTGEVVVKLYITNSVGSWTVSSNLYRVLESTNFNGGNIYYVSTNGNDLNAGLHPTNAFLTLDKAVSVMAASNYVMVLQGVYTNNPVLDLDMNLADTEGERITWVSYGARVSGIEIEFPYYTIDGFEITEAPFGSGILIYKTSTNIQVLNNWIHDFPANGRRGIYFEGPAVSTPEPWLGQVNCLVSNNWFSEIHYVNIDIQGSNNLIIANTVLNTGTSGSEEGDVVRLFGCNHVFKNNYASNIFGGHADCFQFFGTNNPPPATWYGKDMIIEGNIFHGTTNGAGTSICQMENDPLGTNYTYEPRSSTMWTNWVIRNNQFLEIPGAGSIDFDGFKFYNNLFYKCRTNGGAPIVFGGPKGSSYGTVIKNNIFFACGSDSQGGWYPRTNDQPGITWNVVIDADYNYVSKADFTAYTQAPPNADYSFKSDNQDPNGINGGDPKFTSASTFNFHLLTGSPLLDTGTTIADFSVDADGVTRPQGSAWDIGPFEGAGNPPASSGRRLNATTSRVGRIVPP